MPAPPVHPFLDFPGPLALAHRGGEVPGRPGLENSMLAYERAVRLGYRYLETDVQATADGALLTFHDPTLDRTTDSSGRVNALPYREVARARIAGSEPIPLLEDVLGAWPQLRVNIDLKGPGAVGPAIRVLRRTNALARVCVASFSDRRLAAARRALGPALCTSLGPLGVLWLREAGRWPLPRRLPGTLLRRLAPAGVRRARCAQVPVALGRRRVLTPHFLAAAHQLGLPVHAWTVSDPAQMARLLDLGVDGIVTDDLDALRALLLARGQWHEPAHGSGPR